MKLIIVESPTKAKTISKFLGADFKVESSFGHVRDLPAKEMGIDITNNFEPKYVTPAKAKKTASALKAAASKAETVILASDEDREGEAIAWHLAKVLKLDQSKTQRIVFHEITKPAIIQALENPRGINQDLVDAQQARRVLDRLVGYELSPFLWKKVAKGLSAGRVQSVAIRIIVEREREILAFNSQEYWTVSAEVKDEKSGTAYKANLFRLDGKTFDKLDISAELAASLKEQLIDAIGRIVKVEEKSVSKNPSSPFTTSTLQQGANRQLGFSAKQTMVLAQKLYEQGFITYMRTDSLNLSAQFLIEAREYLAGTLPPEYVLPEPRTFKTKGKNAQEAHEAIRPTLASRTPDELKEKLDKGEYRLYNLIWQRTLATQMPAAKLSATTIDIEAACTDGTKHIFRASGQVLVFDGYLKIYPEKTAEQVLPKPSENEAVTFLKIETEQHATKPPARFSDAGLVKEMEKFGIGRPSTYAPTINTIITRNYVQRNEDKRLQPTDIALVVNDLLVEHFPKIVDYNFTAGMENDLDLVAAGEKEWQPLIADFYGDFHSNLEKKYEDIKKSDIMPEETSEEKCDKCGAAMVIKTGRYGKFLACSAFPECRNIKKMDGGAAVKQDNPALDALNEKYKGTACDKCGSEMKVRTGKYGPFLACTAYPKCKNIKNVDDGADKGKEIICPACKTGKIVKKFSKRGAFYACDNYPDCKNAYWGQPTGDKCPDCESLLVKDKDGGIVCSDKGCGYKK
ncbi:type I DNA topoisomerase [Candidatus Falkowbacteria bacterium HGW-Falkowbacteria-2]|uniref:DNA topoisomerase 1 n=1 Tax=Candidatus Falkowbacteria bacterium HGW-Falkowbacteria-2 TaxID=2013769 RepID=A0A2N2E119_9BACT|nr:MAG: type I DNA topoisomerase [Candidatus Falkowbacteria bacterium HGW-Falkowbacteria-2]